MKSTDWKLRKVLESSRKRTVLGLGGNENKNKQITNKQNMHMLSIIIITHTGSVISPSKMVMWAQETDPARLLCNAPYNMGLTHSITLFISINRHPWPITTKKLYNDPDSSWYRMSVFLHQNRPPVIFKRGSLYQYTPEKMVSGLIFLSEVVCHSVVSLRAGRQGPPCQSFKSSADVCYVQSNRKGEKMASDKGQLSIRWCAHTW